VLYEGHLVDTWDNPSGGRVDRGDGRRALSGIGGIIQQAYMGASSSTAGRAVLSVAGSMARPSTQMICMLVYLLEYVI